MSHHHHHIKTIQFQKTLKTYEHIVLSLELFWDKLGPENYFIVRGSIMSDACCFEKCGHFVSWVWENSFHSAMGKKTGVWQQLTYFVLLLNWPAREIKENGVTVNVCYPNERMERGTCQGPELAKQLFFFPFLFYTDCVVKWLVVW